MHETRQAEVDQRAGWRGAQHVQLLRRQRDGGEDNRADEQLQKGRLVHIHAAHGPPVD